MVKFDYELDHIFKKAKYWCANVFEVNEIRPVHLIYSIIKDESNLIYNVFWEMGIDVEILSEELKKLAKAKSKINANGKIYTSIVLEQILTHSIKRVKNGNLTLLDVIISIFDIKNECTPIFKNHSITKDKFLDIYNSFISYEENLMEMGYVTVLHGQQPPHNPAVNSFSFLKEYCKNLSELAKNQKLPKIYGRNAEIELCIECLNKNEKKNILLLGDAGVGKTSIVEGLAEKETNLQFYELDLNKMVAGTKFRGDLEMRINMLLGELKQKTDVVLFIDEAHVLKNAASSDDGLSFLNVLKPPMARGEIQLILATTKDEYVAHLENDKAFTRRCSIIYVDEPDKQTTLLILKKFAKKYDFNVSSKILEDIYQFSNEYSLNKKMPDKAIDILDASYAKAKVNKIIKLDSASLQQENKVTVTESILQKVFKENYNIETSFLYNKTRFKNDLKFFNNEIVGQNSVLQEVIKKYYAYNIKKTRNIPLSYFFMGNNSVGKTKSAELFAKNYLNDKLLIIDCSEYKEAHSISNLIGSPAGYVRSNEGGLLTNYVDKNPRCGILFDEIEEAHEDIYGLLLQILDRGILTDKKNLKANFSNCVVFFTSNIGVKELNSTIGFNNKNNQRDIFRSELEKKFNKKLLNRLNNFFVFNDLTESDYELIFSKRITEIRDSLRMPKFKATIKIKRAIIQKTVESKGGVRMLNALMDEHIYNPLLDTILDV